MLGKVAGATLGKIGGGGGGGPLGKTRRLPIQRWTDVSVPVEVAYREWTNFEEFPKFMHRVLSVNKDDDGNKANIVRWEEKIWFSKRQWEGEITDQRRNDRIAWKTKSGMQHAGVVSFHQIGPRLTRVMVTMDFVPQGMIEKMGSGMRFVKRAVQADLARFKAQVEMKDAKGLEYRSGSDDQKDEKKDEDGESKSGGSDSRGNGERNRENGSNGDAKDDEEREEERREREKRRRERQEKVAS
ncbi:MAG: SRPBCC family protein [Actinobacteria bacterium]|nr:MAG: SRPBCC family protein [Actinomycetota bacterium]